MPKVGHKSFECLINKAAKSPNQSLRPSASKEWPRPASAPLGPAPTADTLSFLWAAPPRFPLPVETVRVAVLLVALVGPDFQLDCL